MSQWFDLAEQELDTQLDNGDIDEKEYREGIRDIRNELRQEAQENADRAYDDTFGY